MPTVTCYLYGRIARILGETSIEVSFKGSTVKDFLKKITDQKPQLNPILFNSEGQISVQVNILVNGHSVRLQNGLDTLLMDSDKIKIDRIDILETVGGGNIILS